MLRKTILLINKKMEASLNITSFTASLILFWTIIWLFKVFYDLGVKEGRVSAFEEIKEEIDRD